MSKAKLSEQPADLPSDGRDTDPAAVGGPAPELGPIKVRCEILRTCFASEEARITPTDPSRPRKMFAGETHELPEDEAKNLYDKQLARIAWGAR